VETPLTVIAFPDPPPVAENVLPVVPIAIETGGVAVMVCAALTAMVNVAVPPVGLAEALVAVIVAV